MTKRIIYISNPSRLSIKDSQLVITNFETGAINKVPVEDINVIELDNPQIILNNYLLQFLSLNKIVVISCSFNHHPESMLVPIDGNVTQSLHIRYQLNAKKPLIKQLWKSIVEYKIINQNNHLLSRGIYNKKIKNLSDKLKSGDKENIEAQASKIYWRELLGKEFVRHRDGDYPNHYLNYAYSILRSLAAREIVAGGLHPTVGVYHKSQYNSFCLADDIMEAYRPFADFKVMEIVDKGEMDLILKPDVKKELLELMISIIEINKEMKTVINAMQDTVQSLVKSFKENDNLLKLPKLNATKPLQDNVAFRDV